MCIRDRAILDHTPPVHIHTVYSKFHLLGLAGRQAGIFLVSWCRRRRSLFNVWARYIDLPIGLRAVEFERQRAFGLVYLRLDDQKMVGGVAELEVDVRGVDGRIKTCLLYTSHTPSGCVDTARAARCPARRWR